VVGFFLNRKTININARANPEAPQKIISLFLSFLNECVDFKFLKKLISSITRMSINSLFFF